MLLLLLLLLLSLLLILFLFFVVVVVVVDIIVFTSICSINFKLTATVQWRPSSLCVARMWSAGEVLVGWLAKQLCQTQLMSSCISLYLSCDNTELHD